MNIWRAFLLFRSEREWIFDFRTMYVYCLYFVYPAMVNRQKQLPNYQKRAQTRVCFHLF